MWACPTEFAGWTKNPKKNIETSNQPIRTKIKKKSIFSTLTLSLGILIYRSEYV
jgi:hypothetical protein